MKKAIVWVIVVGFAGGLGYAGYRKLTAVKREEGGRRQAASLAVEVTPVRAATIRDMGLFTGTLLPRLQFVVAPKVAGRLEKLLVDIADPVKGDQLIAVLDAAEYEEQVAQAKAELAVAKASAEQVRLGASLDDDELVQKAAQARAELAVAQANADQVRLGAELEDRELVQKAGQAQAELESAKANLKDAASSLDVAEREFERAKALREKKILAPAEFDMADAQHKAAKAKHEAALALVTQREAAVKSAQVRLSDTQKGARAAELRHAMALAEQKDAALKTAQVRLSDTQKSARAAELQYANSQVTQKEAALKAAEVRLSYTQIKVQVWNDDLDPRVVGERFVDAGAMLKANDPIVSVLDIAVLKAIVYVTDRDYNKVRPGQEVAVTTDATGDRAFTGRIVRVAPLLEEASRQGRVEIEVPNPERLLKPGMFIRARIEFGRRENATVVPVSCLVKREGRQGVFVADMQAMKARFTPVTPGITEGEMVEVTHPPKALEKAAVVTLGQHLLEDGTAITLPDEAPPAKPPAGGRRGSGGGGH